MANGADRSSRQVISGNWVYVPAPTIVNSVRGGYSRYNKVFAERATATQNPENYNYNGSTYHVNTGQTNPAYFWIAGIHQAIQRLSIPSLD